MRTFKLAPAIAAAALLALAPAGASAHKGGRHHRPHGVSHIKTTHSPNGAKCKLTANVEPRFVPTGESALVFGQLVCPSSTSVAGQSVTVSQHAAGTAGRSTLGPTTTDATGHYQLTSPALLTNSTFVATSDGIHSPTRTAKVIPKVSVSGPADGSVLFTARGPFTHPGHRVRNSVTFSGTISPAPPVGTRIGLQRENATGNEEWRRIGVTHTGAAGSYAISHSFSAPGDANIRIVVAKTGVNTRGASEVLSYEISQTQNPALVIHSSADPLSYGQSVTISGTIAPGNNTPVTLLTRTRTQSSFTTVATAMSSGGSYSFAPQMPLQNTFYEVTGAGKTSARLYNGVKYAVSAAPSASKVQAGQAVMFSGTVTPGHAGHPVYLQVQNPSGVGFHLVAVGTVSASSTYSIMWTPFFAGIKKARVKVPGDPQNQSVASAAATIEVTPAPPAALKPQGPGASPALPSEGQT